MLDGREWRKAESASLSVIETLEDFAPAELPKELLELLRYSNGGEGPLAAQPFWFQLYPAEEIAEIERSGAFEEFFDGLFVFGRNGGGEAIAVDLRNEKAAPVISFDMTNMDIEEGVLHIASDFATFVDMVGRNEISA